MPNKSAEVRYSNQGQNDYLLEQLTKNARGLYESGFYPNPLSPETIVRAHELIVMQNEKAGHRKTARSRSIAAGWETLKNGDKIQGKDVGCMDGRDNEGVNVDEVTESWRLPGGQIALRDKRSGLILEPHEVIRYKPEDLIIVSPVIVARQKLRGVRQEEIFVTVFAHDECMMWNGVIAPNLPDDFSKGRRAVEVHAEFLEDYTLKPFREAHNRFRREPLADVGMVAMLIPENYDTIYKNNGDELSVKKSAMEFKRDIRRLVGRRYKHGEFTEDFDGSEPLTLDRNLDLSERELVVVHELLNYPKFNHMVEDFLRRGSRRFTPLQEDYFKVRLGKLMAFHDAVDFDQIPDHYLRRHRERAVGVSERGNPPLQRHPVQSLAISPANTDKAVRYGEIAIDVVSRAVGVQEPHIFLIASEIPDVGVWTPETAYDLGNPSVLRADANNANIFLSMAYSPRFREEVSAGRVAMIAVAMEQDGYTISGIPDHSYSTPDNTR